MTHVRRPNRRPIPGLAEEVNGEICRSSGKLRYVDERQARLVRDQVAAKDPTPERLHAYRCASCRDWHVGHSS